MFTQTNNFIDNLNIMAWNARAVRNKRIELIKFLENNHIHIALINETWLTHSDRFNIPEYTIYRNDRKESRGGGVAIAVSNTLIHEQIPCIKSHVIENVGIQINTDSNSSLKIYSIYFAGNTSKCIPSSCDLSWDHNHLKSLYRSDLLKISQINGNFLICGDFNSRHRAWKCTRANGWGKILNELSDLGKFSILYPTQPTYIPHNHKAKASTLDLCLTNIPNQLANPAVMQELSSDHLPVVIKYSTNFMRNVKTYPILGRANWALFKRIINERLMVEEVVVNCSQISTLDIDNLIGSFTRVINYAFLKAVPHKPIHHSKLTLPVHITELFKTRNIIQRQWFRSRHPLLKSRCDHLNYIIRKELFIYNNAKWNNKLQKLDKCSKPFWNITKAIKKRKQIVPCLSKADEIYASGKEKANILADVFQLKHNLTHSYSNQNTIDQVKTSLQSIAETPNNIAEICRVTYPEVFSIVKALHTRKSPGIDGIPNISLKNLPTSAINHIVNIANHCLQAGYFPRDWKIAKIVPILKPGKPPDNPESYRPISLLSGLSKILEKLIKLRLVKFLDIHNTLPTVQYGFRNGLNTILPTLKLRNYIKESIQSKQSVGLVTLDIEAAFDTVWHDGLLHKLKMIGTPIYLIKIVQNFLTHRYFSVNLDSSQSARRILNAGVPQGSVLGPTLFNIFTHDIPQATNCVLSLFADDAAVYSAGFSYSEINQSMQSYLNELDIYYKKWKIKINPNKTNAIFFTKRRKPRYLPDRQLRILDSPIQWVDNIRYLGIIFDKKLTFKYHINNTIMKVNKIICTLYPLINRKSKLSISNKIIIFKTIFNPILMYGSPVWGRCAQTHIKKLQICQNKLLKLIMNLPYYTNTKYLHIKAGVQKVQQKIQY